MRSPKKPKEEIIKKEIEIEEEANTEKLEAVRPYESYGREEDETEGVSKESEFTKKREGLEKVFEESEKDNSKEEEGKEQGERNLVKKLEKAPLGVGTKIEILLVWKEKKTATEVSIASRSWKEGEPSRVVDQKRIEETEKLLEDFKLPYKSSLKRVVDKAYCCEEGKVIKEEEKMFYLARKKEDLDLFIKALKENNEELLGRLYGYPESAINAYTKEEEMKEISDLPLDIQNKPEVAFARFKLSKENWQEELQTSKRWSEVVKENSPKLYKEFIGFMRTVNLGKEEAHYVYFSEEDA